MKNIASNKNAKRNYEILKTFEAGIELFGTEVKSISKSNCSINEAYIMINNSEAFIMNMHVANFFEGNIQNKDPLRNRKLLLHKNEIVRLDFDRKKESLTIIPIKLYWKKNKIKVLIGLAKGKKIFDKREDIKKKDEIRFIQKNF